MTLKNYYKLLEIASVATADDIKRAFRLQIARYHPDKVHHLGKEFQDMAAERAAELTEAYRILSHEGRRAEYDAALAAAGISSPSTTAGQHAPQTDGAATAGRSAQGRTASEAPSQDAEPSSRGESSRGSATKAEAPGQFVHERATRDTFVRKATINRFRQAFADVAGSGYDESQLLGFDIACVPKTKLFARNKGPRLLGRFVPRVDAAAVAEAWAQAGRWNASAGDEICVILMGTAIAPQRELAAAIAEQRRRPSRGVKVTLIPVDASVWSAHMPLDAPVVAKDLLTRLRENQ